MWLEERDGSLVALPASAGGGGRGGGGVVAVTQRTVLRDPCTGADADVLFCGRVQAGACAGQPGTDLYQATTQFFDGSKPTDPTLVCAADGTAAAGGPDGGPVRFTVAQLQSAVQEQFASVVPPTAPVAVAPQGSALLNYPAIFYATQPSPATLVDEGLLFGVLPYRIDAAPLRHDWAVDGRARVLADTHQGRPYTEAQRVNVGGGRVSGYYVGYTFDSTGVHSTSLTTTWGGTFTVPGYGTFPIPATVAATSPTVTFDVRAARSQLIR